MVGILIRLRDFLKNTSTKRDQHGRPIAVAQKPLVLLKVSEPRPVIPRLRMSLPKRIQIEFQAECLIDGWRKSAPLSYGARVSLALTRMNGTQTATLAEVRAAAERIGCHLADVEEFIGFLVTMSSRERLLTERIVALETACFDGFGNHCAIVYEHDGQTASERVFLEFAERVRSDWLLLIGAGVHNSSKRQFLDKPSTP